MIYKLICAALLISSGEALKVATGVSRRAAIAKAGSIALPMVVLPAFALNRAADADIYKRADEGRLNAERAIERAKADDLVDGSSASVSHDPPASMFLHRRCYSRFALARGCSPAISPLTFSVFAFPSCLCLLS